MGWLCIGRTFIIWVDANSFSKEQESSIKCVISSLAASFLSSVFLSSTSSNGIGLEDFLNVNTDSIIEEEPSKFYPKNVN